MATGYWRSVHTRTVGLARKAANLDTSHRMIMAVVVQALIGAFLFFFLHSLDIWTRLISAAVPFFFILIWYVLKFPTVPPLLATEVEEGHKKAIWR